VAGAWTRAARDVSIRGGPTGPPLAFPGDPSGPPGALSGAIVPPGGRDRAGTDALTLSGRDPT
jgi:hypothetical protein